MEKLKDKRILVTGGASGIGQAIVDEFAKYEVKIGIHYNSSKEQAEILRQKAINVGSNAEIFKADLTNEIQAADTVNGFAKWAGGIDILINNAGDLVNRKMLDQIDFEFFNKVQAINVNSMLAVTRAALPWLKQAGQSSIVNISSLAGRKGGHPGSLAYSTAKGAVITFTRALSAEVAPFGVRVNAIAPGLILGTKFHATHTTEDSAKKTVEGIPLGRAGSPEDVARAVTFMASEFDGFITGAVLDINGGVYCA